MKIDIPNEMYDWIVNGFPDEEDAVRLLDIVKNGTFLSESEDCISRQAAIDAFNAFADEVNQDTDIHEAIEIVLNLPPVKPEQKWIPVSERLPEVLMVKTLVSCEDDNGLPISTMVALYDAFSKTWDCEYKVIAWMPLPESYKES